MTQNFDLTLGGARRETSARAAQPKRLDDTLVTCNLQVEPPRNRPDGAPPGLLLILAFAVHLADVVASRGVERSRELAIKHTERESILRPSDLVPITFAAAAAPSVRWEFDLVHRVSWSFQCFVVWPAVSGRLRLLRARSSSSSSSIGLEFCEAAESPPQLNSLDFQRAREPESRLNKFAALMTIKVAR